MDVNTIPPNTINSTTCHAMNGNLPPCASATQVVEQLISAGNSPEHGGAQLLPGGGNVCPSVDAKCIAQCLCQAHTPPLPTDPPQINVPSLPNTPPHVDVPSINAQPSLIDVPPTNTQPPHIDVPSTNTQPPHIDVPSINPQPPQTDSPSINANPQLPGTGSLPPVNGQPTLPGIEQGIQRMREQFAALDTKKLGDETQRVQQQVAELTETFNETFGQVAAE